MSLLRRAAAEAIGTALLLAAVVGSGIMAERLATGNVALALLANAVATGAALLALILTFERISGAHFNPAVTLAQAWKGGTRAVDIAPYLAAQFGGALVGVAAAHVMFGEELFSVSQHARAGSAQIFGEFVATFGLVAVIRGSRPPYIPFGVAAYITGAYWFTSSTSFANPAVTLARSMTNTFTGIRPADVPGFIIAQMAGALAAAAFFVWLDSGGHEGNRP